MQGLPRTKESKTHSYICQMEEPRHRRPCRRTASLQMEAHRRKVAHVSGLGGGRQREDRSVEVHRSLVDAKVPLSM